MVGVTHLSRNHLRSLGLRYLVPRTLSQEVRSGLRVGLGVEVAVGVEVGVGVEVAVAVGDDVGVAVGVVVGSDTNGTASMSEAQAIPRPAANVRMTMTRSSHTGTEARAVTSFRSESIERIPPLVAGLRADCLVGDGVRQALFRAQPYPLRAELHPGAPDCVMRGLGNTERGIDFWGRSGEGRPTSAFRIVKLCTKIKGPKRVIL